VGKPLVVYKAVAGMLIQAVVGCIVQNVPSLVDWLWGVVSECMGSVVGS